MTEVVADDTPAVQAVLKADTRRLKLLEEEKQLQARLDKGDDSVGERLDKVSVLMLFSDCCMCKWKQLLTISTFISFLLSIRDNILLDFHPLFMFNKLYMTN